MQRRDFLSMIAAISGASFLGAERAFAYLPTQVGQNLFGPEDAALLDEVAETLLPATDTPGAKAAGVGPFITQFVSDCYSPAEQRFFRDSLSQLQAEAKKHYGRDFTMLSDDERHVMLQEVALAAQAQGQKAQAEAEARRAQALAMQPAAGTAADAAAREAEARLAALHWFTPIQQLALFGFFTSELGATEVLRYEAVPGEYIGDLDYDGGPAWAT